MKIYGVDEAACTGAVKRASPMLRSAKVVCQTGEYVCLVRDVSEDGVLLSYLHEVPGEPRIILSLANGQTYPIQRLWAGEAQAGYRFAGHAPLEEFLHESAPINVRPVRLTGSAAARVIDGSASYGAQLLALQWQSLDEQASAAALAVGELEVNLEAIPAEHQQIDLEADVVADFLHRPVDVFFVVDLGQRLAVGDEA